MTTLYGRALQSRLIGILITFLLLVSFSRASKTAIGVYFDNYDHFAVAVSTSTTEAAVVTRGCFEVGESSVVRIESCKSPSVLGKIWRLLELEDENTVTLLEGAFVGLQQLSKSGIIDEQYEECVITTPLTWSRSQRNLLSSAASVLGCESHPAVVHAPVAIVSALGIEPHQVEDAPIVIIMPSGVAYVLGEEEYEFRVISEFQPPLNLDHITSTHNANQVVIIQSDDMDQPSDEMRTASGIPIRREHIDIIPKGAALLAFSQLPQEPVTILPLALGVVLYGSLSHTVIPRFVIVPRRADIILTTVHHNQRVANIEVREGSRPRANDNLPLATLVLEGLPPAQAGTLQIHVSVEVDRYLREISVEAVEPTSGRKARRVVERDVVLYEEGVLEAYQEAERDNRKRDAEFLDTLDYGILEDAADEAAVRIFEGRPGHEEL
ncbi:heat shock protein 70kD, peptide-binding domain-containing protein [Ceratobasidium sp. AG-I]|nr:heat shock protein 70kD, peptide-binding domain-containing protein [Ceratobasidium sp. AG-I]